MSERNNQIATALAEQYVEYALGDNPNPDEAFSAKEDYAAGYLAGATSIDRKLHTIKTSLVDLANIAAAKQEYHSLSYVRYLIQKVLK